MAAYAEPKGRQPEGGAVFGGDGARDDVAARVSGDAWGPFSVAVASGKFRDDGPQGQRALRSPAAGRIAR